MKKMNTARKFMLGAGLTAITMSSAMAQDPSVTPDVGVDWDALIGDIGTYVGGIVVVAIALRFAFIGIKAGI